VKPNYLLNFLRGLGMGTADVIPGVSGGTVALLTGIYPQLVLSISRFDTRFLGMLGRRQFGEAAAYVDWKFLVSLGTGIGLGFVLAAKSLGYYLQQENSRGYVLATFLGMIVAAAIFVWRMIPRRSGESGLSRWVLAVIGVLVALGISQLKPQILEHIPLWYVFLCAAIGICAMILPGISGAMILLLLGMYEPLLQSVHALIEFREVTANLLIAVVFAAGAVCGLVVSSRTLRWLLDRHNAATLSLLCGLMLGSLPLLWPWQRALNAGIDSSSRTIYEAYWPEALGRVGLQYVLVAVSATVVVLLVETLAQRMIAKQS
jgi:putative membrane protein